MRLQKRPLVGACILAAIFSIILNIFPAAAMADGWILGPASISGNPVPGQTLQVSATFHAPSKAGASYMLDTEIYSAGNVKVAQWSEPFWLGDNQATTRSYTWQTAGTGPGTYSVRQGVFAADWSKNYAWEDKAGSVTLGSITQASLTWQGTARLQNSAANAGSANAFVTTYAVAQDGIYNLDLEVFDSNGNKVTQWTTNQKVSAGSPQSLTWGFTPQAKTYRVKQGIFNNNWQLLYWNDNSLSFSAAGPSQPPVSPAPTPTPAPAPSTPTTPGNFQRGVNLSGAEFAPTTLPGKAGKDYTYPTTSELDYYKAKGLTLFRLPFLWERVQPSLYGPLNQGELNNLANFISNARNRGLKVILDPHNYDRYRLNGTDYLIGSPQVPVSAFSDFWNKFAGYFKNETGIYAYSLMNEPHDTNGSWKGTAQAALSGLRQADMSHLVLVPGDGWSGAWTWQQNNQGLLLSDPANNLMYEAHQYFDRDGSGKYTESYDASGAYPNIGADRVQPFLDWLRANNQRGFVSEYGVPNNDGRWLTVLDNFMAKLDAAGIGGTYWAGGPWWSNYSLSSEPVNGKDAAVMPVLVRHPGK